MVVTAGELGERSGVPATRLCSTGPASALLDEGMLSAGPTQPDEILLFRIWPPLVFTPTPTHPR